MISPVVSIGNAILAGLWASVLDASIVACLVVVAIRLTKPGAATRHLLYWLVLAVAIASPVASIAASLGRVETIAAPTTQRWASSVSPRSTAPSAAAPEIDITIPRSLINGAALGIWLSVALYKMLGRCLELFALDRVKRRAAPLDRARVAALRVWNANAGTLRGTTIAVSSDVDIPCAAGLWAPAILLPTNVVQTQSADDIDRIVMHEAAHLARYDDWTNVCERVLGALLWFNPALAFARTRIAIDREIACDDWVVARIGGAHGYASCLFRLAEATRSVSPNAHALGALGNKRHITERIEHLLSKPQRMPRGAARLLCATIGVVALTLTIVQATQAPAIAIDESQTAIPPIPPIPPKAATAQAAREQADALREVAQELRNAKADNNDAEHVRYEAMREAMRAKGEALREAAEAIHESHLGQAEIQRAMREMQDELKHDGFLSGR